MKRYTFYTIGLDGEMYYPLKLGDQTTGFVRKWTRYGKNAITWKKPEDFESLMNEYADTKVIEIVGDVAKICKTKETK